MNSHTKSWFLLVVPHFSRGV
uniref:Uncharacterized protein n=1 Tax=Arundo donax TaxID=35708 RepID=A0A0A9GRH3_ARUDO